MQVTMERAIDIIGFDSAWGCGNPGTEDGPAALNHAALLEQLSEANVTPTWSGLLGIKELADRNDIENKQDSLPLVIEGLTRLCEHVHTVTKAGVTPVVIGGDHSAAIGTWSGITTALEAEKEFGMIWLDAHMDAHTPETAHEGKWGGWWHGMPVAALIGEGEDALTNMGGPPPKLAAEHISLIGIRSYEPGEREFLERHNVRVYYIEEVRERGFQAVFEEALERATTGTKGFGLSIDLDAFDPSDAPGTGSPEENGLIAANVLPVLKGISHRPEFKGLEIVEYNPHTDEEHKTLKLMEKIILDIVK